MAGGHGLRLGARGMRCTEPVRCACLALEAMLSAIHTCAAASSSTSRLTALPLAAAGCFSAARKEASIAHRSCLRVERRRLLKQGAQAGRAATGLGRLG